MFACCVCSGPSGKNQLKMALAYAVYIGLAFALVSGWALAWRMAVRLPSYEATINAEIVTFTVLVFTILIGCRYAVGGDYFGYLSYYEGTLQTDGPADVDFEVGFLYLIKTLRIFDLPPRAIIVFSSFLQISLLSYWLVDKKFIAPFVVYFFVTMLLLDIDNAIRQGIALLAILIGLDRLQQGRFFRFAAWVCLGILFHRSAAIILPLGFCLWFFRVPGVGLQLAALVASRAFVAPFTAQVVSLFAQSTQLSQIFGYQSYADINRTTLMFTGAGDSLNLGQYLWPIIDSIIILYSRKLSSHYESVGYRIYHGMFLVAALLQPVADTWNFLPFGRMLLYFVAMRVVCLGFLTHYCLVVNQRRGINVALAIGIALVFAAWLIVAVSHSAGNSSPYRFFAE